MGGLDLRHHTAVEAAPLVDELVALYLQVYVGGGEFHSEDRYRRQLAAHMSRDGWSLVTAMAGGRLAGYIYGFPLPAETGWWAGIEQPIPSGFVAETGRRTFAISELLVQPQWRRQGVARALHDQLLSRRAEDRATLLVDPENSVARRVYDSWGWRHVTHLTPAWDDAPRFMVLIRQPVHAEPGT
ncbi:GNAT family N-acetyltransferase [Micromonospora sp. WMMD975]|uniref:GNAT family N-acetyltransferase n=1 Tax=Micromonospora sp. WMMD975 TaxID=3016087 RepID=UPI00249B92C4|nr:GNAT family N-acetyltransferase [Micromonospora sp. WMMD975]WFE33097.1 GNAT family N-acetyltransferase [Micromonospora sp. WMMD975]